MNWSGSVWCGYSITFLSIWDAEHIRWIWASATMGFPLYGWVTGLTASGAYLCPLINKKVCVIKTYGENVRYLYNCLFPHGTTNQTKLANLYRVPLCACFGKNTKIPPVFDASINSCSWSSRAKTLCNSSVLNGLYCLPPTKIDSSWGWEFTSSQALAMFETLTYT